tara:strand:- start:744 stop:1343 length:600 start_codon:yes stop_codon:yes gene_type:complete
MPLIIKAIFTFSLFTIGFSTSVLVTNPQLEVVAPSKHEDFKPSNAIQKDIPLYVPSTTTTLPAIQYRHGDCSWLPEMALRAGWKANQIPKLKQIALRESGCCPNRAGGDVVDKDCNIIGHDGSFHSSDTSILQVNGINYDLKRNPTAPICLQMKICTQEPLFDAFTNLKAGKLLFDYWEKAAGNGWIPWDPCNRTSTCK